MGGLMPETRTTRSRTWWLIGLAFCTFWVAYLALLGPKRRALLENSGMSTPAAYDWSALDLNDQPVSFSKFKGKTVFLNIWATWCGPCVAEMPSIARLANDPLLRNKPIEFVCLSTDSSTEPVRQFIRGKNWRMTFLRAESVPQVFLTEGIPSTFLIAPNGRIAASEVGSAAWDDPQVAMFLDKLSAEQKHE
jgi:thiol-disulfide isomerase/thioredoxin